MGSPSSVPAGAGVVVNKPDRDGPAQQRLLREGNGLPSSALPALEDPSCHSFRADDCQPLA